MSGLVEKLEAAEVGSRVLDGLVEVAIRDVFASRSGLKQEHWAKWRSNAAGFVSDGHTTYGSNPVTTSLDAALALAEHVLPGWYWRAGRTPLGHWHHGRYTHGWAHLSRTDASNCDRGDESTGWAATPALALCIAILRALNLNETRHAE